MALAAVGLLALAAPARAQLSFAPPVNNPIAALPDSVAVADLNHDGRLDIVIGRDTPPGGAVSVLLGNGDGTFGAAADFTIGGAIIRSVAVADVNRDGHPDLVVGSDGIVSVRLGDGAGGFGANMNSTVAGSHFGIAVADLDGNGVPDVVTTDDAANTVSVALGNGNGTFGAATTSATGLTPRSLVIADMNRDGNLDLVVANFNGASVSVLLGNGDGTFDPKTDFATGNSPAVAVGDVDGDGALDVVTANFGTNDVSVLLGDGAGGLGPKTDFPTAEEPGPGNLPQDIAIGDVNGDGRLDIVVATNNGMSIFPGNGDGTLGASTLFGTNLSGQAVAIGDLDRDGKLDVVVASQVPLGAAVFLNTTLRPSIVVGPPSPSPPATGSFPQAVAVGDVNRDGRPDLAVANFLAGSLTVYPGNGNGTFQTGPTITLFAPNPLTTNPTCLAIADVDRDGNPDLVTAGSDPSNLFVVPGNGNATFQAPIATSTPAEASCVALADVNGDGILDAVVTIQGAMGTVEVLLGNGDGTFSGDPPTLNVARSPVFVATGDLNNDGVVDLVVAQMTPGTPPTPGSVAVFLGQGDGSFVPQLPELGLSSSANAVVLGDVNGDGKLDLVVATEAQNVVLFLGAGDGSFAAGTSVGSGAVAKHVALADLNRDGALDIVYTTRGEATVILLGNGNGTFAPATSVQSGLPTPESRFVAVADLNRDGRPDLAVTHASSNTLVVFLGKLLAQVNLGGLGQTFDGTPSSATATTNPPGLTVVVTYDGSPTPPTNAGSYAVAASVSDADFVGLANGTLTIARASQTIAFDPLPTRAVSDPPFTVSATASSGLPVSFGATGACSVAGTLVTLAGAGTCTVTASQAGNANVDPAPDVPRTFAIEPPAVLTLSPTGTGTGAVTSLPAGIDCGQDCSQTFPRGTVVSLLPAADAGSEVVGFGGDPDCADGIVTLAADLVCTVEFSATPPPPRLRTTALVSVGIGGTPSDGASFHPSLSAEGRFVAFHSRATNLTGLCTNGVDHVYVADRLTQVTTCVSVAGGPPQGPIAVVAAVGGTPGNGSSTRPVISADGTVVAFESVATNLVAGCANGLSQIIVANLASGLLSCVSVDGTGLEGNGPSSAPALSADGTVVVFETAASNLACGSGVSQIVRVNLVSGAQTCVSATAGAVAGSGPSQAPAVSGNGVVIAFESEAANLAPPCTTGVRQVLVADLRLATLTCASLDGSGAPGGTPSAAPAVSGDGQRVAFQSAAPLAAPCSNGFTQIFVLNRVTSETRCVSVAPDGSAGDGPSEGPALSGNGLVAVFTTTATNLTGGAASRLPEGALAQGVNRSNVMRSDLVRNRVQQMTSGSGQVTNAEVSRDGSRIGFSSTATTETSDDPDAEADVFVVEFEPGPPADRVSIVAPASGLRLPLTAPTPLTIRWTALDLPGVSQYGIEHTGVNRTFQNPNDTAPDPVNGFGGAGGAFLSDTTRLDVLVPVGLPPGNYQVRVIGLTPAFQTMGRFSDAVTLILGVVPIPADARPTITAPASGTAAPRGGTVVLAWTTVPGVAQYLFEFTGPDRAFANPNGTAPDPGALGSFAVGATGFTAAVPAALAPGAYQVRVIALGPGGAPVGTFSDAVTLAVQ
jgi:Tol biopolymer transport system component